MKSAHVEIEIYQAKNEEWSWRMLAANGQIICTPGETFTKKAAAKRNAQRVLSVREYTWRYAQIIYDSRGEPLLVGETVSVRNVVDSVSQRVGALFAYTKGHPSPYVMEDGTRWERAFAMPPP